MFVFGEESLDWRECGLEGMFFLCTVRDLVLGGELWRRRHRHAMHVGKRNAEGMSRIGEAHEVCMQPHVIEPSYPTLELCPREVTSFPPLKWNVIRV